jgi:hypothetical protein
MLLRYVCMYFVIFINKLFIIHTIQVYLINIIIIGYYYRNIGQVQAITFKSAGKLGIGDFVVPLK